MLRELSVQNLALIEDARIELQPGLCAWTGETGAGKSLLLTALNLVLGGKASTEWIRAGRDEARAAAVFEVGDPAQRARLETILGGAIEDEVLIATRKITAQGRGSAHVNGLPVTVATLRELGSLLIDIHGQDESQSLLDPDRQRAWLDAHAGLASRLAEFRRTRQVHETLRKRRLELLKAADESRREQALLSFERDELAAADPRPGEFEELLRVAKRLGSAARLREAVAGAYRVLYEAEQSAQGLLDRAARQLEPLGETAPELADAAAELDRLADSTREIAYALRSLEHDWDDEPTRLEEVETRLALYRKLAARFRCDPEGLPTRRAEVDAKLAALEQLDANLEALDGPLADAWADLKSAASCLSQGRRDGARAFARAIQGRLKALELAQARLEVAVETQAMGDDPTEASPPASGLDRVEFLFTPNPGEPARPLRRIASGGERSRVTLAIKSVLAGAEGVPTLVFDEIDTGVGGRLGSALGKTLASLARHHQIVCVTHLPQLASFASHQWVIRKQTTRGRTTTTIAPLGETERVQELAVMLRGGSAAETTRREAQDMLAEARSAC